MGGLRAPAQLLAGFDSVRRSPQGERTYVVCGGVCSLESRMISISYERSVFSFSKCVHPMKSKGYSRIRRTPRSGSLFSSMLRDPSNDAACLLALPDLNEL